MLDIIAKDHKEWIEVCKGYGVEKHAEDLVQDMYLKLADSNIDNSKNYRGYVFSTLRNLCYDYHRNNNFNISLIDNLTEDTVQADDDLHLEDIDKAIKTLTYLEQQVLKYNKIYGIGLWEIEKEVGINRKLLWQAKNRAIEKIDKYLKS